MTKQHIPALFALAKEFYHLMGDDHAEQLSYEVYAMLAEYETKLLALGNLLAATNIERFLADELNDAEAYLRCTRLLLGVLGDTKEDAK